MDKYYGHFAGRMASCFLLAGAFLLPASAQAEPSLSATPLLKAPSFSTLMTARPPHSSWLLPAADPDAERLKRLRISFIATEALDLHSTLTAVRGDGREANAIMRPLTGSAVLFVAVKAAATWVTLRAADQMSKRNKKGAAWLLGASTAALSIVAVHNYRSR